MTSHNKYLRGMIKLYLGPMFSGKTSSLLEAYTRHSIGSRNCLLVKHIFDDRYSDRNIVTHSGINKVSSIVCKYLYEIDHLVNDYQVVCVDEIQFFEDAPIFCDKWANQGIIVEASGLVGTYTRSEFPVISKLIPLAEEVYKKSAVCRETGKDANFTLRTSSDNEIIVIGGDDKYKPVDRQTFFTSNVNIKEYEKNEFIKFVKIYCENKKILLTENNMNNLLIYFENNYKSFANYVNILEQFLNFTIV
jgi:thymidine kinase